MTTTAIETVHLSVEVADGIASVVMDRQGGPQNTLFPEFFPELEAVILKALSKRLEVVLSRRR